MTFLVEPVVECLCPDNLLINPDLYECKDPNHELVVATSEYTCPNGKVMTCDGPGHECLNRETNERVPATLKAPEQCTNENMTCTEEKKCCGDLICEERTHPMLGKSMKCSRKHFCQRFKTDESFWLFRATTTQ